MAQWVNRQGNSIEGVNWASNAAVNSRRIAMTLMRMDLTILDI
jgi:hypothetical protein